MVPSSILYKFQSVCITSTPVKWLRATWRGPQLGACRHISTLKKHRASKVLKCSQSVSSVLPRLAENSEEVTHLDCQLNQLDALLSDVNTRIAEQQEQLSQEAIEMERQFGAVLPGDYVNMIQSVDPECPPSNFPCVGCGAPIHCCYPHQPGFISSGKFHAMTNLQKQNSKCLRCQSLEHHNVLLDAKVSPDQYREILSQVRGIRSVILHVIDVTDYSNSMIHDLLDIVGPSHPVYIIANKVDLLPKDSKGYLHHAQKNITNYAKKIFGKNLKHVCLTSAKTGYGIEPLITKIFKSTPHFKSHLHLVGCTNSGKSTLFNALLQSDLCKPSARSKIGLATTSLWPGTTLNMLKFPLNTPSGYMLHLRAERLKQERELVKLDTEGKERNIRSLTLRGLVSITSDAKEFDEDEVAALSNIDKSSGESYDDLHYQYATDVKSGNIREPKKETGTMDYQMYAESRWVYDTPGLINSHQIINSLSMLELKKLLMKRMALPRTFSLRVGMSLFVGGLARVDYLQCDKEDEPVLLTVVATGGLPVNVLTTSDADEFYTKSLKDGSLVVPSAESSEDMTPLLGHQFTVRGIGNDRSETDIQLSSVGWISVAGEEGSDFSLKAYTPGGVGCHTRPSLLPKAVSLRGKRIRGSRAFELRKPMK